jgi:hypothetical protein
VDSSDWGIISRDHVAPPQQPTVIEDCSFTGYRQAGIAIVIDNQPTHLDVRNVTFEGNEFWLGDDISSDSFILHQGLTIRRKDQPGEFRPEWNASVS